MKMTIAYLYHDLLNLYGDVGNIMALKYHLEEQKIDVTIKYLSVNDKKYFNKYDLVYIGSGTDKNLLIALEDLKNYKNDIKKYIDNNKFILATGNSFELFGKYIRIKSNVIKTLNIFNYFVEYDYDLKDRIVKDVNYKCNLINKNIIGFENHPGYLNSKEEHLFEDEGVKKKNFYGSYVIGPLLVRNPEFCKYFIKELIHNKDSKYKIIDGNYKLDELAYKN